MVPSSSELSCSPASLSGTDSVQTTTLVVDAGADDDLAAHGSRVVVDMLMVWAAQSVEQDAGDGTMVCTAAGGATASGSPMAATGTAGSASPEDVMTRSAVSELAVMGASNSELRRKQSEARSIDWLIASKLAIMALKSRWRSACHASR